MFSDLKKRISSVIQDGLIPASIHQSFHHHLSNATNSLYTGGGSGASHPATPSSSSSASAKGSVQIPSFIKLTAGAEYLDSQERMWKELHDNNEVNAAKATEIDAQIQEIRECSQRAVTDITDLNHSLNCVPTIKETVRCCANIIEAVRSSGARVEQSLFELEDLIETLELQEMQLNHRFEMAVYKEKKLGALDQVRKELVDKHATNVREFEQKLRSVQQERQAVFQDAFQNDLHNYRQSGTIPKIERIQRPDITLEEIDLDTVADTKQLDEFLNN